LAAIDLPCTALVSQRGDTSGFQAAVPGNTRDTRSRSAST
jgi:hypothetical protein